MGTTVALMTAPTPHAETVPVEPTIPQPLWIEENDAIAMTKKPSDWPATRKSFDDSSSC